MRLSCLHAVHFTYQHRLRKGCFHGKDTLGPKARLDCPPTTRDMFLPPGQLPSALLIRLLLSRAGDVESNPGPCYKACAKMLRSSQAHHTCSSCGDSSHKQERYSGLSRIERGRGIWKCRECDQSRPSRLRSNAIVLVGQIVGTQLNACSPTVKRRCLQCSRITRASLRPLICSRSKLECHKSCEGLHRGELDMRQAPGLAKAVRLTITAKGRTELRQLPTNRS